MTTDVESIAEQAKAVRDCWAGAADPGDSSPGELLHVLRMLDTAARDLTAARDAVLSCARSHGTSWTAISAKTGVPPTTWRGRYNRYTGVDQP